jgi:hypothetical protein
MSIRKFISNIRRLFLQPRTQSEEKYRLHLDMRKIGPLPYFTNAMKWNPPPVRRFNPDNQQDHISRFHFPSRSHRQVNSRNSVYKISKTSQTDVSHTEVSVPLRCPYCSCSLEFSDNVCVECGESISRCKICYGILRPGDTVVYCHHCSNPFHREHIWEWIKVSGQCPVCKMPISKSSLIEAS